MIAWVACNRLRRALRAGYGFLAALAAAVLVARQAFADLRQPGAPLWPIPVAAALAVLLGHRLWNKLREPPTAAPTTSRAGSLATLANDIELGMLLVVATYVTLGFVGGVRSPLYPMLYALVSFLVAFNRLTVGVSLVLATAGLEIATYALSPRLADDRALCLEHVAFVGFFAVANLLFLQAEVQRQRRLHRVRVDGELASLREEARDFRLISPALSADSRGRSRAEEEERLRQGAVVSIHETLRATLELCRRSLDLHTCALLWLDDSGQLLKLKELGSDSDCIVEGALRPQSGALGAIVKDCLLLNLRDPKPEHLPYYRVPEPVTAFLGVPVLEDGHLRGILVADRVRGPAFDAHDESLLVAGGRQMLRAIQSERVFSVVERSRAEHERFYRASEMLNRALTLEQVYESAFRAAAEIADFDCAALCLYDRQTRQHTICRAFGEGRERLEGLCFAANSGLASMVVKNKHCLPAAGGVRDRDTLVFTRKARLGGMESILVLPLIVADEAIGSFTVASRCRAVFSSEKREMLGVIANLVAVSLSNAKMYRQMEEMARTDGLTGLANRTTYAERVGEMFERAVRYKKQLAFVIADIDHFKRINDSYGHPVGDIVLKRVARLLERSARKIDLVARYGGEEFALVLEETDAEGARQLAERIRADLGREQFTAEQGSFAITLSLGIASYPDDGRDRQQLVERADQALYQAKRSGRNRVVCFAEFSGTVPGRQRRAAVSASQAVARPAG